MGIGPFAYVTFIVLFLKFNDSAYDSRQSMHKTMGVLSYLFILSNLALGAGMMVLDIGLFLFASFFFYRAMSENFEDFSAAGLITVLVFGALIGGLTYQSTQETPGTQSADSLNTEAELKKALETATKALQQGQPPPDLR